MPKNKDEVIQILDEMNVKVPDAIRNATKEEDILVNPSPEIKAFMFQKGYQSLQAGKYDDAIGAFTFLSEMDHTNYDYIFALAAAYHYKKEYKLAAAYYMAAGDLKTDNPAPPFHLYDCYLKSDLPWGAADAICETIALCGDIPKYAVLKERAILEQQALIKILAEDLKKESQSSKSA